VCGRFTLRTPVEDLADFFHLPDTPNRRHRKMQKAVYRVRTAPTIRGRVAIAMQRDLQAPRRDQTTAALHHQRRDAG